MLLKAFGHNSGKPFITVDVVVRFLFETCISLRSACLAPQPLPPCLHVIVPIFQPLSSKQPETEGLLINSLIRRISMPFTIWSVTCQGDSVCVCVRVGVSYVCAYVSGDYVSLHVMERWNVCVWGKDRKMCGRGVSDYYICLLETS